MRHLKAIHLDYDALLQFLTVASKRTPDGYVTLPLLGELPDGARVITVGPNSTRNAFTMVIEHPSFPLQEPCGFIDEGTPIREWEYRKIRLEDP